MFFCICNQVRSSDVRQAINNGISSVESLKTHLGIGANCGSCADHATHKLEMMLTTEFHQINSSLIPLQAAS